MVADVHVQKSLVELRAFQIEGGQIETRMGGARLVYLKKGPPLSLGVGCLAPLRPSHSSSTES